ncbi:MAG: hypothetical protein HKM93_10050 [Desulfobacteraceae bacterium]|nr:hypothetical protein [Desulfobacteraceae bacterium]
MGEYSGWQFHGVDDEAFFEALKAFIDSGFDRSAAVSLRTTRSVFRFLIGNKEIYVKRYFMNTMKHRIQTLFGCNKAQRSCQTASILLAKDVATPRPICLLWRGAQYFSTEYVLVSQGIADSISLRRFVHDHLLCEHPDPRIKRNLIHRFAAFMAHMHQSGIYHGDFTANNILLSPASNPLDFKIYLIDLDAIRSVHRISTRRRVKNLDEIGRNFMDLDKLTLHDRMIFLKYYLHHFCGKKAGVRGLFHTVRKRTRHRLQKNRKNSVG